MTAQTKSPVGRPTFTRWVGGFLFRRWAWFLLFAAVLVFAFKYMPALTLAALDTETVVLPLVYQDIVTDHHSPADWEWPGANSLFPDIIVFFLIRFLSGNDWVALYGITIFFFLAMVTACIGLSYTSRRPHQLGLVSLLVLIVFAEACDFVPGSPCGIGLLDALFIPIYHSGTALLCLVCFTLILAGFSGTSWRHFAVLLLLVFLITFSDLLFVVDFIGPAVLTLSVLAVAFRREWKQHLLQAGSISLVGIAAFFAASRCIPAHAMTQNYLTVSWENLRGASGSLWAVIRDPTRHYFDFLLVLDIVTVLAGLAVLIAFCFFKAGRKIPAPVLATAIFASCAIASDWAATLFTGGYMNIAENRYVAVALLLPLFILAFGLHAVIAWRPWLENGLATAAAVLISACAFIPQEPNGNYTYTLRLIPALQEVMKQNHITAGLITYWRASLVTFLSHGTVPLRALSGDGVVVHDTNTTAWYGKGKPLGEGPRFRLIFPEYPEALIRKFGPPDQVVTVLGGEVLWIYSEEHAITYNEYFDLLSNHWIDHGRTLKYNAVEQDSHIGKIQGTSRLASPEDGDDFLVFGRQQTLKPGHYRASYRYQYLTPPNPGQAPDYDLFIHHRYSDESLHTIPMTYVNDQPQILTDDFTVSLPGEDYEMRIRYHGSGTLRVDSMSLTVLVP